MARLAGIELKDNWKIDYALTHIKGIGWSLSSEILSAASIPTSKRIGELSTEEISVISKVLTKYTIEGDLARFVKGNVTRLQTIGSYRGLRHSRGLPSRGQRTKSNARTKRGKRKTVGAFRKDALSKQTGV